MSTENRRIATYLPREIDEKFKAFKLERGIKGDSNALLTVLSEFLGLTDSVASSTTNQYEDLSQQLSELRIKLTSLESELFSRLRSELLLEFKSAGLDYSVNSSEFKSLSDAVPGQLNLLVIESSVPALIFESDMPGLKTGDELAERLKVKNSRSLRDQISKHKDDAFHFYRWSREKDPEGIAWERSGKGCYRPAQNLDETDSVEDF